MLEGDLHLPESPRGVVLFARGSGSSRHSSRNRYVAELLNQGGLATLLVDLLTADEEAIDLRTARLRFDIELLAGAADRRHRLAEGAAGHAQAGHRLFRRQHGRRRRVGRGGPSA